MTPIRYAFLFIAGSVDSFFALIDRVFHTRITRPKISVEEVEQLIQTRLPIGSTLDKALALLDEQKYERSSEVLTDPLYWDERSSSASYKLAEHRQAIRKLVIAWLRNNGGGSVVSWQTQVCLYFDANDHLLTYLIEGFGIGP
jgi:hypothetical protein